MGRNCRTEPAAEKYVAREKPTRLGAGERNDKRGESVTRREHRPVGSQSATGYLPAAQVTGSALRPRLRPAARTFWGRGLADKAQTPVEGPRVNS